MNCLCRQLVSVFAECHYPQRKARKHSEQGEKSYLPLASYKRKAKKYDTGNKPEDNILKKHRYFSAGNRTTKGSEHIVHHADGRTERDAEQKGVNLRQTFDVFESGAHLNTLPSQPPLF